MPMTRTDKVKLAAALTCLSTTVGAVITFLGGTDDQWHFRSNEWLISFGCLTITSVASCVTGCVVKVSERCRARLFSAKHHAHASSTNFNGYNSTDQVTRNPAAEMTGSHSNPHPHPDLLRLPSV